MTDFAATKAAFALPEGVAYLDGNSLGPLPKAAPGRVAHAMKAEWGRRLIRGWNECGWMAAPTALGDRVGRLIGAPPGTTVMGDTLSVKVYQALAAALEMRPDRRVILSDTGNFPSDLYMAEGLIRTLGQGHELRLVAPEAVEEAIGEDVAALMLTEVDYRTGRRHDMRALTARAHAAGALAIWDLAHSAGAIPVDLSAAGADFAVGCTYKYLNGGPGAPAFMHVASRHLDRARPALSGWLGHEAPFDFDLHYRAGTGIDRMRVGTPPILQLAALEAALDVWDDVDMTALDARRAALTDRLVVAVEGSCEGVALASPRDAGLRGSQVSFRHPEAYAVMQALIAQGVIGDFRAPDILRFGLAPLYNDEADVDRAAAVLAEVLATRAWDAPEYAARKAVT
ncbi:kynureninase [Hasllibacter halocynthiae]|uniref:Kynureninase n=1 Tax=Hasllibacter halocynthiae TaxID=595589 RepID=A0A2T0X9B5_9RHOB|nr:kynureninase [Hasllibacter halocynthiae]PRY95541.1 kynureninase [Hasllibacter halocynthiae]